MLRRFNVLQRAWRSRSLLFYERFSDQMLFENMLGTVYPIQIQCSLLDSQNVNSIIYFAVKFCKRTFFRGAVAANILILLLFRFCGFAQGSYTIVDSGTNWFQGCSMEYNKDGSKQSSQALQRPDQEIKTNAFEALFNTSFQREMALSFPYCRPSCQQSVTHIS